MTPETAEHEILARLETVSGRPIMQRAQAPAQGYAVLRLADGESCPVLHAKKTATMVFATI